ncbi:MAG: hypothetical protein HYX20_04270 [Candidatus Yanofskybacteria bacterium]|nr:hypothetical protein [Candidatus Yanofskybacteria bacterium]
MQWQIYGVWATLVSSLFGLALIIWKIEPQAASLLVKTLFFITLFMLVWSAATLVIFSIKKRLVKSRALSKIAYEPIFYDSFLMGLFFSIIILVAVLIRKLLI